MAKKEPVIRGPYLPYARLIFGYQAYKNIEGFMALNILTAPHSTYIYIYTRVNLENMDIIDIMASSTLICHERFDWQLLVKYSR